MLSNLTYGYKLRLNESSVYTYMMMWYLLTVTYIVTCTGFVFGLEIIHWACGCSTPPLYLFPPGIKVLKIIKFLATLYSSMWSWEVPLLCSFIWNYQEYTCIFELFNSYLDMYVILNTKESCIALHLSLYVRPCEPTIW